MCSLGKRTLDSVQIVSHAPPDAMPISKLRMSGSKYGEGGALGSAGGGLPSSRDTQAVSCLHEHERVSAE